MSTLAGWMIALSVSDAPDAGKLGFPAREVRRVVFSLSTALIREGANILYQGDLRRGGWTRDMFQFLSGTYAGAGITPFVNLLPEPVLRGIDFAGLIDALRAARGSARMEAVLGERIWPLVLIEGIVYAGELAGEHVALAGEADFAAWLSTAPEISGPAGLARARELGAALADARVAVGGKMGLEGRPEDRYEGARPGVAEEARLTLALRRPFIPLGAYGGATRDVAIALGLLDPIQATPRGLQQEGYEEAMADLRSIAVNIPDGIRAELRSLADDDRTEEIAIRAVRLLETWSKVET